MRAAGPRASGARWSLAGDPADRGGRGVDVSLGQPQQGQTRLRFPTAPARLPVGLLGGGEVSPKTMDVRLPVDGFGSPGLVLRLDAALAGSLRLFQGVRPRAVQLQDLGAMHQARAGEGHHVGLRFAPPRQGRGPLRARRTS